MRPAVRWVLSGVGVAAMVVACGSSDSGGNGNGSSSGGGSGGSSGGSGGGSSSGGSSGGSSSGGSSGSSSGSGGSSGGVDAGPQDSGPPPWNGTFSGPLTCSGNGSYNTANKGTACGVDRWDVKTGSDSAASTINLNPKLTTIASLVALSLPTTSSGTPRQSQEVTTYAVKDVTLTFARLEDDGDYHLVMSDGTNTFIGEIPFPGCVSGGPLACNITRARATVDANLTLVLDQGHNHSLTVSAVGVAFSDFEHGQFGAAPNMFEMHALLAICFGAGCDPTKT